MTPFGRQPVTVGLMKQVQAATQPPALPRIDKWALFRDLCTARAAFEVSNRDLTVLNALLSFFPGKDLSDQDSLIVFPSNASLSARAHGMAESTMRRHLAALVKARLIRRHDSPNGKRYAARSIDGTITRAFGFDLRPLLERSAEIAEAAQIAEQAAQTLRQLREEVSLIKRDAIKLCAYGKGTAPAPHWTVFEAELLDMQKFLRRKLSADDIIRLKETLSDLLAQIVKNLPEAEEMSGDDGQNERHHSNSEPDSSEIEGSPRKAPKSNNIPALPIALVLKACPDILNYTPHDLQHWHELVALAGLVRPMMGISLEAWEDAQKTMGPAVAATTVVAILQRVDAIRSPGGYLRALTARAAENRFSPGPMIMALIQPGKC